MKIEHNVRTENNKTMNLNSFEINLIKVLIQGDSEERTLLSQLDTAKVINREYNGVGLYTDIQVSQDSNRLSKSSRYIEETPKAHMEHPDLPDGAGALLWFTEGFISTLECYTYDGDWPKDETKFTFVQNNDFL